MSTELIENIKLSEGYSEVPYEDDKGVLTIGYGTNISNISKHEAELLLQSRIDNSIKEVMQLFGMSVMLELNESQKESLYELCYWLGLPRMRLFKNMIKAVTAGSYQRAGDELLDSKLGREYKTRANRLANKLRKY